MARIIILGAGAVGRLWAAYLTEASHDIIFALRKTTPPSTPAITYQFTRKDEISSVCLPWVSGQNLRELLPGAQLMLVTTKAGDALNAIETCLLAADQMPPMLLFQNGMGSQQTIAQGWPEHAIFAASTTEGAKRPSENQLVHSGLGVTAFGPLTAHAKTFQPAVNTLLASSGLDVESCDEQEMETRLWQKLAINAGINPFTAELNCLNGELLGHPRFEKLLPSVCAEIACVMQALNLPGDARALETQVRAVARKTASNVSSMLQDIRQHRPTEIDYINGYIVREAERLGIPCPANRELWQNVTTLTTHHS